MASQGITEQSISHMRFSVGTPLFMRAPGEATGSIALESAIDEMARHCHRNGVRGDGPAGSTCFAVGPGGKRATRLREGAVPLVW